MITTRHIKHTIITTALAAMLPFAVWAQEASPLGAGSWWRITVEGTGLYSLTTADLPALQGAACNSIAIWGADGEQLSTSNQQLQHGELKQIAIEVVDRNGNNIFDANDQVLFFAEGTDVWRYATGDERWEMQRHAYATANYYFICTNSTQPTARIEKVTVPTANNTVVSTRTAAISINHDLVNIYESGQLWMGEKFSTAVPTRTFSLSLPAQATDIKLRYAMASKSTASASFSVGIGSFRQSHYIGVHNVYSTVLEAINYATASLDIEFTYQPNESAAEGYLDYIEMSGHVPMAFGGGQMLVRNDQALDQPTATFACTGAGGNMRVWDVTEAGAEREMSVEAGHWNDSTNGTARTYLLFDGSNYLSPSAITSIENQDLHSTPQADYIVVSTTALRAQAERLASLHSIVDGMSTLVVTDRQVFNEYSSGKADPMAIRALLRDLRRRYPQRPPRYLLLLGKATYDNRNLQGNSAHTLVTFETVNSFDDDGLSYCSDDMLGYLDDNENGSSTQSLDVSVGRLPAATVDEAKHMIDKIEAYMMRSDLGDSTARGDWRQYVALLSDDADPSRTGDTAFVHSSEATAQRIKDLYPQLNIDRLYADAYRQQSGAIGSYYPDLNNALRQRLNYGCLLINYIGHGSQKYIGTERYIEPTDIAAYTNIGRLPLFVTSTCSYGYFDKPDDRCGAELFMLADGGAVAVISAARPISHIERFNTDLVLFALDTANTIGDALRLAKNRTVVSPCIGLCGDPGLRLSMPQHRIVVTHIDSNAVADGVNDSATALSVVTISGEVQNRMGQLVDDFDGTIYPIVFDRETQSTTLANDNPGTEVSFSQQKSILYKGAEPVHGGRFSYTFTVPRDVPYRFAPGKLSHYAKSDYTDAGGSYSNLCFGGFDEEAELHEMRPAIRLYMGDTNFVNGGLTSNTPTLLTMLADSVGINAFGSGLGHDITATIDGNAASTIVLNDFYQPDIENPQQGTIRYTFSELAPGIHTLQLKAWNIWGYSNTASIKFKVCSADSTQFGQMSVYPNPATDHATFHLETNAAASITSATLQIYSAQGALLYEQDLTPQPDGYTVGPAKWNTTQVPPGIYLGRITATTNDGNTHTSAAKCIVTK